MKIKFDIYEIEIKAKYIFDDRCSKDALRGVLSSIIYALYDSYMYEKKHDNNAIAEQIRKDYHAFRNAYEKLN